LTDVNPMAAAPAAHELSRSLENRHVTMITIGGVIGAGLFVGSSAAIAAAGPAIIFSYVLAGALVYIIMRMLGEMAGAWALGFTSPSGPTLGNLTAHGGFAPKGWTPVFAAVATVFFSITGSEIATVAAAESKEPSKAIVKMGTSIAWRLLLFYVASVFLIVCVVSWPEVKPGQSPFTLALNTMGFGWASTAMSVVILTAVLSCLNSAVYVSSRVLYALADKGDAPRWLVEVNARRVPARSIMIGAVAGVIGVVVAKVSPQVVFAFLVKATGTIIVFLYLMTAFAHILLRRAHPETERQSVKVWLFPWLSYLAIAGLRGPGRGARGDDPDAGTGEPVLHDARGADRHHRCVLPASEGVVT
jgi:L-asparagine transporter-like permease